MFVEVGEIAESGEGVDRSMTKVVPATVRLVLVDDGPVFGPNLPKGAAPLAGKVFRRGTGRHRFVCDRELHLLGKRGLSAFAVDEGELPNQVVEGTSEVMNRIPGDEAPAASHLVGDRRRGTENVVAGIGLVLELNGYSVYRGADRISVGIVEPAGFEVEGLRVLSGPIDLGPDAAKVGPVGARRRKGMTGHAIRVPPSGAPSMADSGKGLGLRAPRGDNPRRA